MRAKVSQIGNSIGLILHKEAAARLKMKTGDSVFLTETSDGYTVSPYDPEFVFSQAKIRKKSCKNPNFIFRKSEKIMGHFCLMRACSSHQTFQGAGTPGFRQTQHYLGY